MGKPTGFLEIERRERGYDKPTERLKSWREFTHPLPDGELEQYEDSYRLCCVRGPEGIIVALAEQVS